MADIAQSICEAITTIVDKSISEAGYDKTIQGKITGTIDSTIGSYRVSYQDSTFIAYSTSTDVTYTTGSTVYVLVPSGDFSKDKTILGTVKKLGINYVSTVEGQDAYDINGVSVVTSSDTFTLSSYGGMQAKVLYSKDNKASENLITIDSTAIDQYIKTSSIVICGMTVRTSIPTINQYSGDYGIIFALDFEDNATGDVTTRYYTINVDKMSGNPYKLITATEQYGIFDIDGANFKEINYISLFCYDFPNSSDDPEDDIFISDITLCGAEPLSSEDLDNYSLTFTTPQGTYFTANSRDTLTLTAQVRVKGKVIDNSSQSLSYYWFTEHAGITSTSLYYNRYGGKGWKCLNDYTVIDAETNTVQWVAGSYQWTINRADVLASSVTYKCAVVYDGTVISKTIEIKNLDSEYEVTIESDNGTKFYFDIGSPTLTCYVNGEEHDEYSYSWAESTYDGTYTSLTKTTDINEQLADVIDKYNSLISDIETGDALATASEELLNSYLATIAELTVQRVDSNKIYDVDVSAITTWTKYICTVYYGEAYLGTASITIINSLETEGAYSLIINNGSHVYKYDESGVSPASDSVDNPIAIEALTFTLYNNLGEAISDDVVSHCNIQWIVPTVNTLITVPSAYEATEETDTTATYSNITSFSYDIASKYDISKTNNNITLLVTYQGLTLSAITDLTFTKEGEVGTNGTEYTCKIVPNISSGTAPKNLIVTWLENGSTECNYTPRQSGKYLKVQLYHSETKILDTVSSAQSDEGIQATITWSILQNTYGSSKSDPSSLSINSSTGVFTFGNYLSSSSSGDPANIVKITISYDGVDYYATFPVITVKLSNNDYRVTLKENTGFLYAIYTSDGLSPKYDNSNPFELTVTQTIDSYSEDVSTLTNSNYVITYNWSYLGKVYENSWVSAIYLKDGSADTESNQWSVKPASEFDGQCVTNAIECVLSHAGTEVARIHIPVHLYLNRYGLAYLNSWDGNSVNIDNEGGYILAPQVGAGIKNSNNTFTGVVIGAVKEANSSSTDVGLFGYSSGARSIFLNASDGSATFGEAGKSQIIIDPSSNKAQLYSGNYSTSAGTGMLIDLTTPEIKYGSGNFSVNANGYLTAKGGGSIAGFNIDDDSLYTGSKSSSTNVRISSADFQRTVNGQSDSTMRMAFSNNFGVNSSGKMYAASGTIGSGSNKIKLGKSSGSDSYSAIYSGNKTSLATSQAGFYIGTDGIALGTTTTYTYYNTNDGETHSRFEVNNAGRLYAYGGYFQGSLVASSGTIGGWTIGSNSLTATDGTLTLKASGEISGGTSYSWSINSAGKAVFSNGEFSGKITASSGTIGGWTIGSNTLTGGNVTLNSSGAISGSGWSITNAGKATFSNISVTGGSISGGSIGSGATITLNNNNTTIYNGTGSGSTFDEYIESLAVKSLNVSGSLTFQNRTCKWQSIDYIESITFGYRYGTVNGQQVITSVSMTTVPSSMYVLTAYTAGSSVVVKPGGSDGELIM